MQTDWAWSRATDTESYALLDPIDAQTTTRTEDCTLGLVSSFKALKENW